MANERYLSILKQGALAWNRWRTATKHWPLRPDLTAADLSHADLMDADLSGADLSRADLPHANLTRANLRGVNLSRADLSHANLFAATLSDAALTDTDLTNSLFDSTILANVDLSAVRGLDTVFHDGPSYLDIQSLYQSRGRIPDVFLHGIGAPNEIIDLAYRIAAGQVGYYSCFISYSSKDQPFADCLYADLQNAGVRCWFAPHDLPIGEPIVRGLDEAIRLHEKLLLILSREAIASGWVEYEVTQAQTRESREKRTVLFPIRLDDAVFETDAGWARRLCSRHIGDFRAWQDHDAYQAAFNQLLRDLKQPEVSLPLRLN